MNILDRILWVTGILAIVKLLWPIRFFECKKAVSEWRKVIKHYNDNYKVFNIELLLISIMPDIILYILLFLTIVKRPGTGGLGCLPARDV